MKGLTSGVLAGLAGSWVMNQFQSWISTSLSSGSGASHGAQSIQEGMPERGAGAYLQAQGLDQPDDNAAERTANIVSYAVFNHRLTKSEKDIGGTISHYVFGAATGAIYGLAAEVIPQSTLGRGLPYGAAVWLVADEGVVPALGLSLYPKEYPVQQHAVALASHLVFGLTLDIARRAIRKFL